MEGGYQGISLKIDQLWEIDAQIAFQLSGGLNSIELLDWQKLLTAAPDLCMVTINNL